MDWIHGIGRKALDLHGLRRSKYALQPLLPAVLDDLSSCDSVQPPRDVSTVKIAKTATHHQKDFLGEILDIRFRSSKNSQPPRYMLEPGVV